MAARYIDTGTEQLGDNINATHLQLGPEDLQKINAVSKLAPE